MPQVLVQPRKTPKQERSQSIVGSMVEAATRVLKVGGYARLTTNKVAEIAGVSIGSLYQYFPGKDALVAAVLDRQVQKATRMVEEKMEASRHLPLAQRIELLVASSVDFYLDAGQIHRELFVQGGRLHKIDFVLSVRRQIVTLLERELEPDLGKHAAVRAFVAVNSTMGVVMTMVLDEENKFSRAEIKRELSQMINAYVNA